MDEAKPADRKVIARLLEWVVLCGILSFLFAFILPAVNAARRARNLPEELSFLVAWYEPNPWFFVLVFPLALMSVFTFVLAGVRAMMSARVRERFPWWATLPNPPPPLPPIPDGRPAVLMMAIAAIATSLLVFAAAHVHADRTHRRPIVTSHGPAAGWIQELTYMALGLSVIAIIGGAYVLCRFSSRWNKLGWLAICLGNFNLIGTLFFYAVVYED